MDGGLALTLHRHLGNEGPGGAALVRGDELEHVALRHHHRHLATEAVQTQPDQLGRRGDRGQGTGRPAGPRSAPVAVNSFSARCSTESGRSYTCWCKRGGKNLLRSRVEVWTDLHAVWEVVEEKDLQQQLLSADNAGGKVQGQEEVPEDGELQKKQAEASQQAEA